MNNFLVEILIKSKLNFLAKLGQAFGIVRKCFQGVGIYEGDFII
jgi:hypothetical protein